MNYKRIALIGISASGKSTASRVIALKTKLPLFHMDQLFWKGNWEAIPEAEYLQKHQELIAHYEWIIEGYIDEKMASRLTRADLVIYLDYSGMRCAYQLIKRWILHRRESRPELAPEAVENINLHYLWMVLTRRERTEIEEALKETHPINLHRISSPKDFQKIF